MHTQQWRSQDLDEGGTPLVNAFLKIAGWQRRLSSDEKLFRERILETSKYILLVVATNYRLSETIVVSELLSWLLGQS
jgi:hypothetical protein